MSVFESRGALEMSASCFSEIPSVVYDIMGWAKRKARSQHIIPAVGGKGSLTDDIAWCVFLLNSWVY